MPSRETLASPRILVIDDDPLSRRVLRARLEAPPLSATVLEASDGAAGLCLAFGGDLDCVLCDVNMPRLSGVALLRLVRAKRTRAELPFILMTATDDTDEKITGFRTGASDFLQKPFETSDLVARIENQIALTRMHEAFGRMGHTDPLTGVWNRRRFIETMVTEMDRAERLDRPVSVLVVDIDRLGLINDVHGTATGDAVLASLIHLVGADRRGYEAIGRVTGGEIAVILPEVDPAQARVVAERLRFAVNTASLGGLPEGAVTVSIGLSTGPVGRSDGPIALLRRAAEQVSEAKRLGRNRVAGGQPLLRAVGGRQMIEG